jgi:hypothetical protein
VLSRIRSHLRQNVVAYVALFFALGGTSAYATHLVVRSSDIVDNQVKTADVRDDNLTGGGLGTADIAANALGTGDIAQNALTGADIANVERAVDVPLPAFVGCNGPTGAAQIPFQDIDDDTGFYPSYNSNANRRLQLVWDDDGTQPDAGPVCTSVRVPDDYAGGGDVVLTGVQVGAPGDDDWAVEFLQNRAGSAEDQVPTIVEQTDCEGTNVYACRVDLGTAFTPGDMLTLGISRMNSSPDETRLLGVHFVYTATG